jgi:hypothetical protein
MATTVLTVHLRTHFELIPAGKDYYDEDNVHLLEYCAVQRRNVIALRGVCIASWSIV